MMTAGRYHAEIAALSLSLPPNMFRFCDMDSDMPYLKMVAITNSKKMYTIRVDLDKFPESIPKVFVTKMLKNKFGRDLNSPSHGMHTLSSEHGYTQICHYGSYSWRPDVSLNKVYLKCRVWLEAYEAHLQTGKNICEYLGHQS